MQHLPYHDLDMLVIDLNTLGFIYFLHLVHQVALRIPQAAHSKNVMRVYRSFRKAIAGPDDASVFNDVARTDRESDKAALRR